MEKAKLIKELIVENETFSAHLKRISKPGYTLHVLDVDVMLEKLRKSYAQLLQLQALMPKAEIVEHQTTASPVATTVSPAEQKATIEEVMEKPVSEMPHDEKPAEPVNEEIPLVKDEAATAPEIEIIPEVPVKIESHAEPPSPLAEPLAQENHDETAAPETEENAATETPTPPVIKARTTIDLFTQESLETLGDKLNKKKDPSIAERMQQSPIVDLRSAIGINEKFLFINELFKGNLNQYNKTIDELNAFESLNGAFTYLIETKVQQQWDDTSPVFKKLKELIERKFR